MPFTIGGKELDSRLFVGSALYPSPSIMQDSIKQSKSQVVTVALRRMSPEQGGGNSFWGLIKESGAYVLPNTAHCYSAKEAITTAQMAREIFNTNWIKLEVIGNDYNLQADPFGLVEATKELVEQGFEVFPYCTDDLVVCERLVELGCSILMPWASPIGTARGIINPYAIKSLRARFPDVNLILDAGIGAPSHATQAMELGCDAVLLNTAIAQAKDPVKMAVAFRHAVESGRLAFEAGIIPPRDLAQPSTPTLGLAQLDFDERP